MVDVLYRVVWSIKFVLFTVVCSKNVIVGTSWVVVVVLIMIHSSNLSYFLPFYACSLQRWYSLMVHKLSKWTELKVDEFYRFIQSIKFLFITRSFMDFIYCYVHSPFTLSIRSFLLIFLCKHHHSIIKNTAVFFCYTQQRQKKKEAFYHQTNELLAALSWRKSCSTVYLAVASLL